MLIRVTTEINFKSTDEYKEMLKFEAENDMTEWHKKRSTIYTTFWKEENWTADMRGEEA